MQTTVKILKAIYSCSIYCGNSPYPLFLCCRAPSWAATIPLWYEKFKASIDFWADNFPISNKEFQIWLNSYINDEEINWGILSAFFQGLFSTLPHNKKEPHEIKDAYIEFAQSIGTFLFTQANMIENIIDSGKFYSSNGSSGFRNIYKHPNSIEFYGLTLPTVMADDAHPNTRDEYQAYINGAKIQVKNWEPLHNLMQEMMIK